MSHKLGISSPNKPTLKVKRTCSTCKLDFFSNYYWDSRKLHWHPYSRCLECRRKSSAQWYYKNLERSRANSLKWKRENKDRLYKGKWYGNSKSRWLYSKMREAGIPKDEARSEAIKYHQQLLELERSTIDKIIGPDYNPIIPTNNPRE